MIRVSKNRMRTMLIVVISVLCFVLCLLIGVCIFLEDRVDENGKEIIAAEQVKESAEEGMTETIEAKDEECAETNMSDTNCSETIFSGNEAEGDREVGCDNVPKPGGGYETDMDYGSDDAEDASGDGESGDVNKTEGEDKTEVEPETSGGYETDMDYGSDDAEDASGDGESGDVNKTEGEDKSEVEPETSGGYETDMD